MRAIDPTDASPGFRPEPSPPDKRASPEPEEDSCIAGSFTMLSSPILINSTAISPAERINHGAHLGRESQLQPPGPQNIQRGFRSQVKVVHFYIFYYEG
jgi:hypothetical protein